MWAKLALQLQVSWQYNLSPPPVELAKSCTANLLTVVVSILRTTRRLPAKMWFCLHVVMYNNSGYFSNNSKEVVSIHELHSLLHKFGRTAVESLRLQSMTSYGCRCA